MSQLQTGNQMGGQQMNQNPGAGLINGGQPQQLQPIFQPTSRDVLNGRGQGVQRHPGNVKYRTLVFVNKVSSLLGLKFYLYFGSDRARAIQNTPKTAHCSWASLDLGLSLI